MRYFLAAAEELNLTRASRKLNISQPAVSRLIKELECELGTPLFVRERLGLRLTEGGATFLRYVRHILAECDAAVRAVKNGACRNAELRIGFITTSLSSFLGDTLAGLAARHPEVDVTVYEMSPGDQIAALRNRQIDIAFIGHPGETSGGAEFETEVVKEISLSAVLPANHRLSGEDAIGLKELEEDLFVGFLEEKFPGRNRTINEACARAGFRPRFTAKVGSLVEVLGIVGMAKGVCLMPEDVKHLPHPNAVFVPLEDDLEPIRLTAAWLPGNGNIAIRYLLEALRGQFP